MKEKKIQLHKEHQQAVLAKQKCREDLQASRLQRCQQVQDEMTRCLEFFSVRRTYKAKQSYTNSHQHHNQHHRNQNICTTNTKILTLSTSPSTHDTETTHVTKLTLCWRIGKYVFLGDNINAANAKVASRRQKCQLKDVLHTCCNWS